MTGQDLFEKVFAKQIEKYGEFSLYEIEEVDEVTCYDEDITVSEGWYSYYLVTFRYEGKKYSFEYRKHTSDNVCETEHYPDTFEEVVPHNELDKAINKIIKGIEDETYGTWEEIVQDLEGVKQKFSHLNEVQS